jgi:hypothetical protein
MQLETAASAFVSGLVRKDVRASLVRRPAGRTKPPFSRPSRSPGPDRGSADGRTSSGALAVEVVWKCCHAPRDIEHLGLAHTGAHPRSAVCPARPRPDRRRNRRGPATRRPPPSPSPDPHRGCALAWPKSGRVDRNAKLAAIHEFRELDQLRPARFHNKVRPRPRLRWDRDQATAPRE